MHISGSSVGIAVLLSAGTALALEPFDTKCFEPAQSQTCTSLADAAATISCVCSQMSIITDCDKKFFATTDPLLSSAVDTMSTLGCFGGANAQPVPTTGAGSGAGTATGTGSGGAAATGSGGQKSAAAGSIHGRGGEAVWVAFVGGAVGVAGLLGAVLL